MSLPEAQAGITSPTQDSNSNGQDTQVPDTEMGGMSSESHPIPANAETKPEQAPQTQIPQESIPITLNTESAAPPTTPAVPNGSVQSSELVPQDLSSQHANGLATTVPSLPNAAAHSVGHAYTHTHLPTTATTPLPTSSLTQVPPPTPQTLTQAPSTRASTPGAASVAGAGASTPLPASHIIPPVSPQGSPTRVYVNTKVTPWLLEGMKWIAVNEPEKPLKWLSEYLARKSLEVEG